MLSAPLGKYAMIATASTSRDTLADGRQELHECDDLESKEILCAAANIHWKGAPTSLHDPVFGTLGLMGRMRVLQYLGMYDLMDEFIADEQDGVSDDDEGSIDARERVVESEDESDEPSASDRTTSAKREVEVVDVRFLPGEEKPESKDEAGDTAHEIPMDPAKIPLPESDDDELLEATGDDKTGPFAGNKSADSGSEQVDEEDNDSGDSGSDESDSGDELYWSSPINGFELEEEEQDARGENQDEESSNENDPWGTPNPRKRARTSDPGDEDDEPPRKMSRLEEDELLDRFEGNVLKLAIYNAFQRNMASKLEANSYWHEILFQ